MSAAAETQWPTELTPELRNILGMICFEFIGFAQLYRAAGHPIPTKAEDEQAYFLHKFIGFWFTDGPQWHEAALAEMNALKESLA